MRIRLRPDSDMSVQKQIIGRVPTLILKPKTITPVSVGLLWIHGGGYITGMKEMVYMSCAVDILKQYGVMVFSPGYRLAWLHPYPAAVNDCFTCAGMVCRRQRTSKPASSGMKITAGLTLSRQRRLRFSGRYWASRRKISTSDLTISKPGRWAARSLAGTGTGEHHGPDHSDDIHGFHDGPVL